MRFLLPDTGPITLLQSDVIYAMPASPRICCYWHCLTNLVLPIIELISSGRIGQEKIFRVPSFGRYGYIFDDIKRLGIANIEQCKSLSESSHIIALDSFDPFCRVGQSHNYIYRPGALKLNKLISVVSFIMKYITDNTHYTDIIIIDRIDANRNIPNMDELYKALLGIKMSVNRVRPETLTFSEQVILYRNTKLVIGQHGSALANLVWTADQLNPPNVIEIVPPKKQKSWYYTILYNEIAPIFANHYRINQQSDTSPIDVESIFDIVKSIMEINLNYDIL